ncbi:MAG: methyltransferase [Pseudomonadota bacterium]|nr:methyltransferase [Pseudomonadota bacterium]
MSVPNPDRFLDGLVVADQSGAGFRSGLDAVMLAAAVPAGEGETALELGSGAGVASLCLAARVPGCEVWGLEIDAGLVRLAAANAAANNNSERVHFLAGDVLNPPPELRHEFYHVFCNPPFHAGEGQAPPDPARARALHDEGALADWLKAGLRRTASGGTFTAILRADRLAEALAALPERGLAVLPLWPKAGAAAKRVILQASKGARAPLALLAGLVLHEADGRYTPQADAILRGGESLSFLA